jgi:hypothetical protein
MLLHVIEKIRATQNDFRNFHYQVEHEQLEDKQIRRNPKPNLQSVIILCKMG